MLANVLPLLLLLAVPIGLLALFMPEPLREFARGFKKGLMGKND